MTHGQRDLLPVLVREITQGSNDLQRLLQLSWDHLSALLPLDGLAVLRVDEDVDEDRVVTRASAGSSRAACPAPQAVLDLPVRPEPTAVDPAADGTARTWAVALLSAGRRTGVLVLSFTTAVAAEALCPLTLGALALQLEWALERREAEAARAQSDRATAAFRALLEQGARAGSVQQAGEVLARAAAAAFAAERAGVYLVDEHGVIAQATGVGVSPELHASLVRSLVGKPADGSPVWRATAHSRSALVVDDAARSPLRAGGFVQAMGFVSYVAIPLLSQDGALGLVIVGDAAGRRTWTPFERDLAAQLALQGGLVADTARLRQAEQARLRELTYQALHDGLTGLPGRDVLTSRLDQLVRGDDPAGFALLLLDLNDFKQVNDGLGHASGDLLLQQVATRLAGMPGLDAAVRLGGDEFALLVRGPEAGERAEAVAADVRRQLTQPFELGERCVHVSASTGIAVHPCHGRTPSALMRSADVAMYAAKRRGAPSLRYDPVMDALALDRLAVYSEMHRALEAGELRLHYQPKVDLTTGRTCGVEALVRRQHPERGLLGPGAFLPVCEETDLVHPLTAWVLRTAVAQWRVWRDAGLHLDVAVNVSVLNLRSAAFGTLVDEVLAEEPDVARSLVLEVTETAVMTELDAVAALLQRVRARGVRIAMDDFGAGHSTLTQLRVLPVDELKIDRMLVTDLHVDPVNQAMVRTIVELARHLGVQVVAEGVEEEPALQVLRAIGCQQAQGYHLSRPLPPEELFARQLAALRRTVPVQLAREEHGARLSA